jgi:hypothetical protein
VVGDVVGGRWVRPHRYGGGLFCDCREAKFDRMGEWPGQELALEPRGGWGCGPLVVGGVINTAHELPREAVCDFG